ncbi:MAG: GFO/IDH/MOCA family oxidoreductase [Bacteroidetes bacterium]|nr:MAG: GFO/IDH/MOCA family oxidoreductase [Bacteroidota bacterium]
MKKKDISSRRDFLKIAAIGTAALGLGSVSNVFASSSDPAIKESIPSFGFENEEPTGNQSVMGLACEPLDKVRIAIIGIGMRGSEAVERLLQIEGVQLTVLCDLVPDFVKKANQKIQEAGHPAAAIYTGIDDWMKICEREDVDLVYNCTPWDLHTPIAVYAMKHGKHAAIEVPAAISIEECWQLVNTSEETRRHCMMLENCCYDFFELATLNMARQGVFGEILHAEGAYIHDLREWKFLELKDGGYYNHWRLEFSKKHNGNLYPTHGLGPIAQIMGINRGDRFDYLTSMSTKQAGISLYAAQKFGPDSPEAHQTYLLGDMNTTLIRTVNGRTLKIQHDTTSPRPYDRIHLISGTKGMARKYPQQAIALEPSSERFMKPEELDALLQKYEHPLARQIGEKARLVGGHGGMDYIMDYRLIYCLRKGLPLDQDVYDAAAWSSIVYLSEKSVTDKSNSVRVPDFTRGAWVSAAPWPVVEIE